MRNHTRNQGFKEFHYGANVSPVEIAEIIPFGKMRLPESSFIEAKPAASV